MVTNTWRTPRWRARWCRSTSIPRSWGAATRTRSADGRPQGDAGEARRGGGPAQARSELRRMGRGAGRRVAQRDGAAHGENERPSAWRGCARRSPRRCRRMGSWWRIPGIPASGPAPASISTAPGRATAGGRVAGLVVPGLAGSQAGRAQPQGAVLLRRRRLLLPPARNWRRRAGAASATVTVINNNSGFGQSWPTCSACRAERRGTRSRSCASGRRISPPSRVPSACRHPRGAARRTRSGAAPGAGDGGAPCWWMWSPTSCRARPSRGGMTMRVAVLARASWATHWRWCMRSAATRCG